MRRIGSGVTMLSAPDLPACAGVVIDEPDANAVFGSTDGCGNPGGSRTSTEISFADQMIGNLPVTSEISRFDVASPQRTR